MPHGISQSEWDTAKDEARHLMIGRAKLRGMIPYSDLVTPITERPPHRSVRAAFPHTAPTSDI
jgi:hypothetical protein